jgi:hypothetical protein
MKAVLEHLPWLVAAVILAVTVLLVPAFARADYWATLSEQYVTVAVLALALTPIVLTGGIDLSVGSVTVFTSVVIGVLIRDAHWPIVWAMAAGLLAGALGGVLNGALVAAGGGAAGGDAGDARDVPPPGRTETWPAPDFGLRPTGRRRSPRPACRAPARRQGEGDLDV